MVEFLKNRILLFILVIAGDWVSLAAFIKAAEIKHEAITIAVAVSLLPSLVISLIVRFFFQPKIGKQSFVVGAIIVSALLWIGFIVCYIQFSRVNNGYGKVAYPINVGEKNARDSIIVGGCNYTKEARAEVDDYASRSRTLTPAQLFEDFNYDIAQIWSEAERDCAKSKILNSFATMLAFLIAGITLTCEILIARKNDDPEDDGPEE